MSIELIHGDCLEILPTLEAESVDAVVTDPPYFLPATHYQTRRKSSRSLADLSMDEGYFNIAKERIEEAQLQMRLPLEEATA